MRRNLWTLVLMSCVLSCSTSDPQTTGSLGVTDTETTDVEGTDLDTLQDISESTDDAAVPPQEDTAAVGDASEPTDGSDATEESDAIEIQDTTDDAEGTDSSDDAVGPTEDTVADVTEVEADTEAEDGSTEETPDVEEPETIPTGSKDWIALFGGSGSEEVKGITADSDGNVYVAGTFKEAFTLGDTTLEPLEPGTPDAFVASFDSSGVYRWSHALLAEQENSPLDIQVDKYDNIYIAGAHKADLTAGDTVLPIHGSSDPFVVAYDSEGTQLWAKNWGGEYGETPRALSINTEGDVFITGSFQGEMVADSLSVQADSNFGSLEEIFVLAVDGQTQEALWLKAFTGLGHDVGTAIVADPQRSAVVAVSFLQDLTIDEEAGLVFSTGTTNFNAGLVRLDGNGNVLWAHTFGGAGTEEIIGLDLAANGNVFAGGVFSDVVSFGGDDLIGVAGHDMVVASYDAAGQHLWSHGFTGGSFDQLLDLDAANNGVYITGRYKEDLTLGPFPLDFLEDHYDVVAARLSQADGEVHWALTIGSSQDDQGNGIAAGGDGSVYVGGYVKGDIPLNESVIPMTGQGTDGFILRITEE